MQALTISGARSSPCHHNSQIGPLFEATGSFVAAVAPSAWLHNANIFLLIIRWRTALNFLAKGDNIGVRFIIFAIVRDTVIFIVDPSPLSDTLLRPD